MTALEVFTQQNGDVTKAYYAKLNTLGVKGELATALFRAIKRSYAAKNYRGRQFSRAAYDVKDWSISEICRILSQFTGFILWGWGRDDQAVNFEHVLYVELPAHGQVSFHSADRLKGPDFPGVYDGARLSKERILAFCDEVAGAAIEEGIGNR